MTWVDVVMFAFVALLLGLAVGFKAGTSIRSGKPTYTDGFTDGIAIGRSMERRRGRQA